MITVAPVAATAAMTGKMWRTEIKETSQVTSCGIIEI
jgi:hypothetical protein